MYPKSLVAHVKISRKYYSLNVSPILDCFKNYIFGQLNDVFYDRIIVLYFEIVGTQCRQRVFHEVVISTGKETLSYNKIMV